LRQLIERIDALRLRWPRHSAAALCRLIGLPYSTFRRWRARWRRAEPIRRNPGPAKPTALPVAEFRSRVAHLHFGPKRTGHSGALIRAFQESISRRRLQTVISRLRGSHQRRLRRAKLHVTWHLPNLAWAIDALHLKTSPTAPGLVVVLARDLASHFHFEPLVLKAESASANRDWLHSLCLRHGPPLILKRDNGAPFNAPILNGFLDSHFIIPLNSPVRRPSYNGAIEHGVGSFKRAIHSVLDPHQPIPDLPQLLPLIRAVIHLHNSRPRRSLAGLTPAQAYFQHPGPRWPIRQRRDIFDWILANAQTTIEKPWEMLDHHSRASAWRRSVVAWLRCQHLISVSQKPQPSPHFQTQIRS
jgi:hypothetical protein